VASTGDALRAYTQHHGLTSKGLRKTGTPSTTVAESGALTFEGRTLSPEARPQQYEQIISTPPHEVSELHSGLHQVH